MTKPRILECTLRDGSYAINFSFTSDETRCIVQALEAVGFDLIEVGHGAGLGASEKGLGIAAQTDEEYLAAASKAATTADWGMFCIPTVADLDHVDLAASFGMKFIRIGTNLEHMERARAFISRAKHYGMLVCANFMKSYACLPERFADAVAMADDYGADVVYIVDSAGGMLPDDIARYVDAVRRRTLSVRLGFHGHNNLGLGVANSLRAIQLGIEIVDSSLQGLGRSAGNTPTELLLCALIRSGVDLGIDPIAVMDAAESHVLPLICRRGLSAVDTVAGLAQFHSSYMPTIERFATAYRVDPRRLIIAVCAQDRINADERLVESCAKHLAAAGVTGTWKHLYDHYYGGEQSDG